MYITRKIAKGCVVFYKIAINNNNNIQNTNDTHRKTKLNVNDLFVLNKKKKY